MIGLDTNILVRYILTDDAPQAARASRLIESLTQANPGYISLVTVAEFYWVLHRSYQLSRSDFILALSDLMTTDGISFQDELHVNEALDQFLHSKTADFSDCLIARSCASMGCDAIMTFDKQAAKSAGMTLL